MLGVGALCWVLVRCVGCWSIVLDVGALCWMSVHCVGCQRLVSVLFVAVLIIRHSGIKPFFIIHVCKVKLQFFLSLFSVTHFHIIQQQCKKGSQRRTETSC